MFCRNCGCKLEEENLFCPECGTPVRKMRPASQSSVTETEHGNRENVPRGGMTYTEAIRLAKLNDQRGFDFLYHKTAQSKLYLAIKYMKNEEAARDVLQDAYLRAFSHLDQLQNPEHFSTWFGTIVANTAKNALSKKTALIFSELEDDEDSAGEFEDTLKNENTSFQPEENYTKEETVKLAHELIDALSDEQRLCILMYHIENIPIREIARAMNCSENTVKSRLNYGRKNIQARGEALRKQGYTLYTFAPIPFLIYVLRRELRFNWNSLTVMAESVYQGVIRGAAASPKISGTNKAETAAKKAGGNAAGKNAAGAAAAKGGAAGVGVRAAAIVLAVGVGVGAGVGIYSAVRPVNSEAPASVSTVTAASAAESAAEVLGGAASLAESVTAESVQEETEEVAEVRELSDDEFPQLLEGSLTKTEVEFVFAYGPMSGSNAAFPRKLDNYLANSFLYGATYADNYKDLNVYIGDTQDWRTQYSVSETDRILSVYTDEKIENVSGMGGEISGDSITLYLAQLNFDAQAEVTHTAYSEEEESLTIYYTMTSTSYDSDDLNYTRDYIAACTMQEDGKYRITDIYEGAYTEPTTAASSEGAVNTDGTLSDAQKALYRDILSEIENENTAYTADIPDPYNAGRYYSLCDLNGDGVLELVLFSNTSNRSVTGKVFGCTEGSNGLEPKIYDDVFGTWTGLAVTSDGRVYATYINISGIVELYWVECDDSSVSQSYAAEYDMSKDESDPYDGTGIEQYEITDLSPLS